MYLQNLYIYMYMNNHVHKSTIGNGRKIYVYMYVLVHCQFYTKQSKGLPVCTGITLNCPRWGGTHCTYMYTKCACTCVGTFTILGCTCTCRSRACVNSHHTHAHKPSHQLPGLAPRTSVHSLTVQSGILNS